MTEIYYETTLPNFEFKDGKPFFKFRNPIKLDIIKKIVWVNDLPVNIKSYNTINSIDFGIISYKIMNYEEENKSNELKIKIYESNMDISYYIGDILKEIEYQILGIYTDSTINSDDSSKDSNDYKTVYSKRTSSPYNKLEYNDNSNNYSDEEYI